MIRFDNAGRRYRPLFGRGARATGRFTSIGREVRALEGVSLEMRAGEVLGLAGPNGAGKSTLIALLMGFLAPSEGSVTIEGLPPRRWIERNGIGYLSELVNIPPAWRAHEALRRYALLAGVPAERVTARCDEAMAMLGLEEHRAKRVRQLSKGNLQRLGLAQALLCEERVIVLDEPTHGLDPVWTGRFRDVVDRLRRPDRLVLIASHNLDELARLADRVVIVDRGRLQRIVDVKATERDVTDGAPYRIVVAGDGAAVHRAFPGARAIGAGELEVGATSIDSLNAGLVRLIQEGTVVTAFYPVHSALEQQFRDAVAAGNGAERS
ncbi:MAG: transporter related protein [Gemmatimonadetes bacterium]|nr:transporter related protein [Gemmatimonadota bacterium]